MVLPAMRGRKPNFDKYAMMVLERKKLKSAKTYIAARAYLGRFAEFFRGKTLNQINDAVWADYCLWRRKHKPSCVLFDDRKHLSGVLLAAFREGLIPRRVYLTKYDVRSEKGREVTRAELHRLYEHASAELTFEMDIALKMGLRQGEMLRLRWERILWDKREVHLTPGDTKTRRGRVVPIHEDLFARYQARFAYRRGPYVHAGRDNANKAKAHNRRHWQTCKRKAAVDARWHDLRHTCATHLVRANVPLPVVSRMLGMSIKVLVEIYAKVQTEDLWAASRAL